MGYGLDMNFKANCLFAPTKFEEGQVNNKLKMLTERDHREWKLLAIDPHDRYTWRCGVRSSMHAASQLPDRGPTDVDVAPVPAR